MPNDRRAWTIIEDGLDIGAVFADTRGQAMWACVASYTDAWNCKPAEALLAFRVRRAPELDHLAQHVMPRRPFTMEYLRYLDTP